MKPGDTFSPRQRGLFTFVKCPVGLLRSTTISPGAKLCWSLLADLCSEDGCFPGHKYLMDALGMPMRTVKRYIRELRKAGLIRIERPDSGPDRRRNRYLFIWQEILNYGSNLAPIDPNKGPNPDPTLGEQGTILAPILALNRGQNGTHQTKLGAKIDEIGAKTRQNEGCYKEDPDSIQRKKRIAPQNGAAAHSADCAPNDYPVLKRLRPPADWDGGDSEVA